MELESLTKRRFFLVGTPDMHSDHVVVLSEGKLADVAPESPLAEGAELQVELVEVDRHDGAAGVAHVDGVDVCVGNAAELVGKKVKVKIERVFEGVVYASLVGRGGKKTAEPLTAEAEAEKPTRRPPARKAEEAAVDEPEATEATGDEPDADATETAEAAAKKKTRRGTRGGRNRKKKPTTTADGASEGEAGEAAPAETSEKSEKDEKKVTIHLPPDDLGEEPSENGDAPAAETTTRKKTRRGSRGGKNRRKREARADGEPSTNGAAPDAVAEAEPEPAPEPEKQEDWGYVPMSQWGDEFE
jgi:predicted RNA-binding protein with TRAM domain